VKRGLPVADILTLAVALYGIWLVLSGHYTSFLLTVGLIVTSLCVYVALRMQLVDEEGVPISNLKLSFISYLLWLCVEVVRSNIPVVRAILQPRMGISPTIARIQGLQRTDLGRFIFANSITLTPGTTTLDVLGTEFEVYALFADGLDGIEGGEMDRRVAAMERGSSTS